MKARYNLKLTQKIKGRLLTCSLIVYSGLVFALALHSMILEKNNVPPPAYLEKLVRFEAVNTIKTSINFSDQEMLEKLPGIGPVIAQRIIDYRQENGPFTELEQLMNVNGIGAAKFDELKHFIEL